MKTIIIPTDYSATATNALHYGLEMAQAIQASVLLLHVYQVPVSFTDTPIVLVSVEELRKNAEEKMKTLREEVEHITSGKLKIYAETRLGNIVDELQDVTEKVKPFAVVMGSKGSTGLEKALFGSTTLSAIRHIQAPVICVPPGRTWGTGIHKIGFACDFKDVVETTPGAEITEFVKTFNAELHVLNVDYHNRHFSPDTPEQSALLHTMLETANPVYHFIEHRDIEDGINEFAEKNNLDLVIAIPKKHKLLEGLFRPSSTKQLVFQSHVPVLCMHE